MSKYIIYRHPQDDEQDVYDYISSMYAEINSRLTRIDSQVKNGLTSYTDADERVDAAIAYTVWRLNNNRHYFGMTIADMFLVLKNDYPSTFVIFKDLVEGSNYDCEKRGFSI